MCAMRRAILARPSRPVALRTPLPSVVRRLRRDATFITRQQRVPCAFVATSSHSHHPLSPLPQTDEHTTTAGAAPYPAAHAQIEKRLLLAQDWPSVRSALTELQSQKGYLRLRAHQHAVEIACAAQEVAAVQSLMKDAKDRNVVPMYQAFVAVIGLYRDAGMIEAAMDALETFQRSTPHFRKGYDARLVSSVISVCGPRDVFRAIKLFHDMLRAGVEPDARAYASIIYACVRGSRVRKAEEFLREMIARNLPVDSRVYTAVINRMPLDPAVQDTPVRILALLQEMREHGHQPDAMLYVTLIRALSVHASHTDTALQLLQEMQEKDFKPPASLVNGLIATFLAHDPKQAEAMLVRMKAGLVAPDQRTYALLMEYYARNRQLPRALQLMSEAASTNVRLLPQTFTALLEAAARAKDMASFAEITRAVKASGIDTRQLPPHLLLSG